VHRIGRTARGVNATGTAVTMVTQQDAASHARDLVSLLEGVKQPVPDQLRQMAASSGSGGGSSRGGSSRGGSSRGGGARGGGGYGGGGRGGYGGNREDRDSYGGGRGMDMGRRRSVDL
jgi:ATP-dependent RNA helicase DDX5/DBP2